MDVCLKTIHTYVEVHMGVILHESHSTMLTERCVVHAHTYPHNVLQRVPVGCVLSAWASGRVT